MQVQPRVWFALRGEGRDGISNLSVFKSAATLFSEGLESHLAGVLPRHKRSIALPLTRDGVVSMETSKLPLMDPLSHVGPEGSLVPQPLRFPAMPLCNGPGGRKRPTVRKKIPVSRSEG
jgi:hypothetical protein